MNDYISRQAAIDAADAIISHDISGSKIVINAMTAWKEYLKTLWEEYLKTLPSAEPKWIPVTERLPEEKYEYLVSIKWGDGTYDVDVYEYTGYNEWNDGDMCGQTVIAWMPLPEPYREEE